MLVFHHLDGAGGAVAGAVAAAHAVGEHHAVVLDPYGMADMDGGLLLLGDGLDGTGRADLAATGALGTAVADLIRHGGLHEMHQVGRGTQHVVGTGRHTELAGGAVFLHVPDGN